MKLVWSALTLGLVVGGSTLRADDTIKLGGPGTPAQIAEADTDLVHWRRGGFVSGGFYRGGFVGGGYHGGFYRGGFVGGGYHGGFYRPFYGGNYFYSNYRPIFNGGYYSNSFYYSRPVFYNTPVYYGASYYYPCSGDVSYPLTPAQPQVIMPPASTVPNGNPGPFQENPPPPVNNPGSFQYNGGPISLVPLPSDTQPASQPSRPTLPREGKLVANPATIEGSTASGPTPVIFIADKMVSLQPATPAASTTPYTFRAYGEEPLPTVNRRK